MRLMTCAAAALLVAATAAGVPGELRRDVSALRDTGVTGVLARLETPAGVRVVRSGEGIAADPYLRIGSTTKSAGRTL